MQRPRRESRTAAAPMLRPRRALWLLAAASLVAACAAPYLLVAAARQTVGGVLSVQPASEWNRIAAPIWEGRVEIWTQDGAALDALVFVLGAADGEALFMRKPDSDKGERVERPPPFRRTMTSVEVAELYAATLVRNLATPMVSVSRVEPATLGGVPGFRFDFVFTARDEVEHAGTAVGAVRGGKLYLVAFEGARLAYFERWRPEFERIVASARFVGQ